MFVRLKVGPRIGEVVEMKYADATPLLQDGRAELAYPPDPTDAPPAVTPPQVAAVEAAKAAPIKKKKRR